MPYKCTVCGKVYKESSEQLRQVMLRGHCECGKNFMMYIPEETAHDPGFVKAKTEEKREEEKIERLKERIKEQAAGEKSDIDGKEVLRDESEEIIEGLVQEHKTIDAGKDKEDEKDVKKEVLSDIDWLDKEFVHKPDDHIYFDIETVKRLKEGSFELDVGSLMSGDPYIIKAEEGVYYISLPSALKKSDKALKEKKRDKKE